MFGETNQSINYMYIYSGLTIFSPNHDKWIHFHFLTRTRLQNNCCT